jgi:hypothetical protein
MSKIHSWLAVIFDEPSLRDRQNGVSWAPIFEWMLGMPHKFRAIALKTNWASSVVYHPKIRTVKAEATEDLKELAEQYPDLPTRVVIIPTDPLWKDD